MTIFCVCDCSGGEHKEGLVHHNSLLQYSLQYFLSWWCICNKSVDFHRVAGRQVSFTPRPCPSCWSLVLQRWGTCSLLLPRSMCRWPNPERSQATRWPEGRQSGYLIVSRTLTRTAIQFFQKVKMRMYENTLTKTFSCCNAHCVTPWGGVFMLPVLPFTPFYMGVIVKVGHTLNTHINCKTISLIPPNIPFTQAVFEIIWICL